MLVGLDFFLLAVLVGNLSAKDFDAPDGQSCRSRATGTAFWMLQLLVHQEVSKQFVVRTGGLPLHMFPVSHC